MRNVPEARQIADDVLFHASAKRDHCSSPAQIPKRQRRYCRTGDRPQSRHLEQIAAPRDGLHERVVYIAQRLADFDDALDQAVIGHGDIGPDCPHQLFLGDELARLFG